MRPTADEPPCIAGRPSGVIGFQSEGTGIAAPSLAQ
jgi:hypothetical protein